MVYNVIDIVVNLQNETLHLSLHLMKTEKHSFNKYISSTLQTLHVCSVNNTQAINRVVVKAGFKAKG